MYISLALYFSHSPAGIITGLQLISLQTQTRRNKMLKTKITEKLWSKNGNGKRQLACAHNFPERRTCRKWQLLAFDCFTDDVNDVSTHRLPPFHPVRPQLSDQATASSATRARARTLRKQKENNKNVIVCT